MVLGKTQPPLRCLSRPVVTADNEAKLTGFPCSVLLRVPGEPGWDCFFPEGSLRWRGCSLLVVWGSAAGWGSWAPEKFKQGARLTHCLLRYGTVPSVGATVPMMARQRPSFRGAQPVLSSSRRQEPVSSNKRHPPNVAQAAVVKTPTSRGLLVPWWHVTKRPYALGTLHKVLFKRSACSKVRQS
ncbi:hypothetical protein NDU88_001115 [Pleurodeles waltl]|uniref:Uncharacterized protein n=1 Tax=Pleurodeles waltl TaxID=8319 RepID=A0AAV7THV1_PLEWA|nr:hypothetical protein NDU88_001115 [Pleurodeles waltl]